MSNPPQTYYVPRTQESQFTLPKGHYKYWARHLNAGSRLKVRIEWPTDAVLQFCIVTNSMEGYLEDNSNCLVKLTSRSRIVLDYVTRHSADHFFIVESVTPPGFATPPPVKEPLEVGFTTDGNTITTVKPPPSTQYGARSTMDTSVQDPSTASQDSKTATQTTSAEAKLVQNQDSTLVTRSNGNTLMTLKSSDTISRSLKAVDDTKARNGVEEPEFFIIRAEASFEMSLLQYDTADADDLFVGSFSKEFEFNSAEWLVLYNPSESHIYAITLSLSRRYKELLLTVFFLEFILLSTIAVCCYRRYSTVPLLLGDDEKGLRHLIVGLKTGAGVRHVGDTRSKSMDDVEEEAMDPEPWNQGHPATEQMESRRNRRSTHPYASLSASPTAR